MKIASSEHKPRKYGWLVLFIAVSIVLMTVWFREGGTGPLHRVRIATQSIVSPISQGGKWVTSPIRGFFSWVNDLGVSRSQLQELRAQNESLRARVVTLEEARLQNIRLKDLVDGASKQGYEGVAATVIGLPSNSWEQIVTLDKGSKDGIALNMPVLGPHGLFGQVVEVGSSFCRVRLVTDQNSGVASMVQRGRIPGITRGSISAELTLDFVSAESTVTAGDVVLTSGIGGIYPKGLIIGEVREITNEANALYKQIKVTPANKLDSVEEVLILTSTPPAAGTKGKGE